MRLDLDDPRPSQTREPALLPPEEEAVRIQDEIFSLKLRIEELEGRRDEAIAKALAAGIKRYAGYRFGVKKPAGTLSEKKLAEQYPEIMDGYIAWYQKTHEAKLSKAELSRYLQTTNNTNPDQVIADITEPGKGQSTVTITKMKEADE